METNEANVFLFLASIIIGLLIAMNMDLGKGSVFLDIGKYDEAYSERVKLQNEIYNLQEEYLSLEKKLNKFDEISRDKNYILNEISEELKNNRIMLGTVDVKGEGIKITLNDAPEVMLGGYYDNDMLIHDTDLVRVINDLRNAGAEAIAVNDNRIVYNSSGICWGSAVRFNDISVIGPFYITAIGNKEILANFLLTQETQLKKIKRRKCFVEVETMTEIKMPTYYGTLPNMYLQPVLEGEK